MRTPPLWLALGPVAAALVSCGTPEPRPVGADTADDPVTPEAFAFGGAQPCAAPVAEASWVEVGETLGFRDGPAPDASHELNGGTSVVDWDGDGDLDLVVGFHLLGHEGGREWRTDVYLRDGDTYTHTAPEEQRIGSSSLNLADLDGDGDLDLIGPRIWVQLPEQTIHMLPDLTGSGDPREATPADIDGDGDIDLVVGMALGEQGTAAPDVVLHNDGGTFTVAGTVGDGGAQFDSVWLDMEHDGDPDLYVVNDQGYAHGGNTLLLNDAGTLSPAESCACELEHDGMSADIGDYDADGHWDLYLAASHGNRLLHGDGQGAFIDVTAVMGADPIEGSTMGWSGRFVDLDNDAQLDLLVLQGDQYYEPAGNPIAPGPITWLRQDGGTFERRDFDTASWRSVVTFDENGDGVLDFLVSEVKTRPRLYRSTGCTAAGWLVVEAPLNSEVRVTAGGQTQLRYVHTDSSYAASGPAEVWFGLGEAATVDRLEVQLPWGGGTRVAEDVAPRQRVRLTR